MTDGIHVCPECVTACESVLKTNDCEEFLQVFLSG